jgi:two-component system, NtrC family, nitrogen regulation sensor histidine kinase NtrY
VSLRARIIFYLVVLHAIFAGLAFLLLRQSLMWLLPSEILFLVSLGVGVRLARRSTHAAGLAAEGARLIAEGEFTSRFRPTGDRDADALVDVYNRMVDHLRAERTRVEEQQQFLAQVLAVSPAGLVILGFDAEIAAANQAAERLVEQPRTALVGRPLSAIDGPIARVLQDLPAGRSSIAGVVGARRVRCHHGTFVDRGYTRSFFLIEELTEELRQSERAAYERLIRVMSHEVNNTATASNSLLHSSLAFGKTDLSRDDFERAIGIVMGRTEQLRVFMRRFADVFRLPAPQLEDVDLVSLLEPVRTLVAALPEASTTRWTMEVEGPRPIVRVDRAQFEQALINVLKNGAEAAGREGLVRIRVDARQARPVLEVVDSGVGISAEVQAHLFTPFYSTKPGGQGIGLTLVQEVLGGHGLRYSLESRPDGTVFKIEF